jgi:hypothetical protein
VAEYPSAKPVELILDKKKFESYKQVIREEWGEDYAKKIDVFLLEKNSKSLLAKRIDILSLFLNEYYKTDREVYDYITDLLNKKEQGYKIILKNKADRRKFPVALEPLSSKLLELILDKREFESYKQVIQEEWGEDYAKKIDEFFLEKNSESLLAKRINILSLFLNEYSETNRKVYDYITYLLNKKEQGYEIILEDKAGFPIIFPAVKPLRGGSRLRVRKIKNTKKSRNKNKVNNRKNRKTRRR